MIDAVTRGYTMERILSSGIGGILAAVFTWFITAAGYKRRLESVEDQQKKLRTVDDCIQRVESCEVARRLRWEKEYIKLDALKINIEEKLAHTDQSVFQVAKAISAVESEMRSFREDFIRFLVRNGYKKDIMTWKGSEEE